MVATLVLTSAGQESVAVVTSGVYRMELEFHSSADWKITKSFAGFEAPF